MFEFIKGDLAPQIGSTSASLYQSCASNYRLTAFFKYLQANLLNNAPSRNKFTTCCQIIGNFQQFEKYIELRFVLFFLRKCQNMKEINVKWEVQRIICRYSEQIHK